mmetsp:Transcript_44819/g.93892  ORF Transcript_44819/g.93892 Transcript_44819/m.93892 type:complete len:147 (-) Transcript_44819:23-463(-)|eukprot:CAMPEP_0172173886 /NCGR_PEP_ID=MMETSP1050-20130122/13340_1 /TAXON_ID=233186 /ORGANISM="Cryptomonas curvata, Strain CCAP979/52" /LENGTH=146 /DNA_ID=CAMNT_0012845765 /DNA_START=670 /DNA_END=1110 /DNA_ORIENTATION=-
MDNAALSKLAGRGNEPWKFTAMWPEMRMETEQRFRKIMGPNADGALAVLGPSRYMSNSIKVAYMELMMNQHTSTIELERFSTEENAEWHGIKRFVVRKDKRPAFDAGFVPSVVSCNEDPTRGSCRAPEPSSSDLKPRQPLRASLAE